MKGKYSVLIFILVVISVGTVIYLSIDWAKKQEIKKVNISGNLILGEKEILDRLSDELIDSSNANEKVRNIQKLLKQNPYIQETYVTHKNLNEIKVQVKEKKPVAALVLENGNLAYIDAKLNILPYQLYHSMPDVPLVNGIFQNGEIDTTGLVGTFVIIENLNQSEKAYLMPLISEINYNKSNKTFNLATSDASTIVRIGTIGDIANKINKLDSYYKNNLVKSRTLPAYIDLRWGNQVVVAN